MIVQPPLSEREVPACACCSFCHAPLYADEGFWRLNGYVVCRVCFPAFAERELSPYYYEKGEWTHDSI